MSCILMPHMVAACGKEYPGIQMMGGDTLPEQVLRKVTRLGITACQSYAEPLVRVYGLEMRPILEPDFIPEVCIFTRPGISQSPAAESFVNFLHRFVKK
jgi:DNA-binding transcriptional LysR family regulator